ncbi:erythromycin esterase family protein [Chitinophaga varians]|uniref:erythromycin esterase family protein n=1 Tax=Chitinophaga varians TaxID=2202339 RepID=UPI00165EDAE5|nr:erythromycin esterase family protein [Chitinophaga varians]MBC9912905.1 erythromycin esterase family protein [Chitinophaga varians]
MKKILSFMLLLVSSLVWAQQRYNLDMEKIDSLTGWPAYWQGFTRKPENDCNASTDSTTVYSGRYSIRLTKDSAEAKTAVGVAYTIPVDFSGKEIVLRGYVRTEGITGGWGGLWMRTDGAHASKNMRHRNIEGTTPWAAYEITLQLDKTVTQLVLGGSLTGKGKMWMDSLSLLVDGKNVQLIPAPRTVMSDVALNWLKVHAMPLKTVDAGHGSEDLQRLRLLIGDARIVALGECTHGTSEVFRMKHRLLEFLVTEMGFRIFTMEANLPETNVVNEYVLYGKGTPETALKAMNFWIWNTREVLEMVQWIRAYNMAHPHDMVQFAGVDMQFGKGACNNLLQFASQYAPELKPLIDTVALYVEKYKARYTHPLSKDENAQMKKPLDKIAGIFDKERKRYQQQAGDSIVRWQEYNLVVLQQYLQSLSIFRGGYEFRDKCMAENVVWLTRQYPARKMVLWAHSGHVGRSRQGMGGYLDKVFGKDMLVIGFGAAEGQYTAIKNGAGLRRDNLLCTPVLHSFEAYAQASGMGDFILDIRREQLQEDRAGWLLQKARLRNIGALARDDYAQFEYVLLPEVYDMIIYLEHTTASNLLTPRGK